MAARRASTSVQLGGLSIHNYHVPSHVIQRIIALPHPNPMTDRADDFVSHLLLLSHYKSLSDFRIFTMAMRDLRFTLALTHCRFHLSSSLAAHSGHITVCIAETDL
jgi:hypothetical protein